MPPKQHEPIRTCVLCGRKARKRDLVRVVATIHGTAVVDADGVSQGRGAYVCLENIGDVEESHVLGLNRLSHALRISITAENWKALVIELSSMAAE